MPASLPITMLASIGCRWILGRSRTRCRMRRRLSCRSSGCCSRRASRMPWSPEPAMVLPSKRFVAGVDDGQSQPGAAADVVVSHHVALRTVEHLNGVAIAGQRVVADRVVVASVSETPASWLPSRLSSATRLRSEPVSICTPRSNSCTVPLRMVIEAKPLIRMPTPRLVPSMVLPSRSMVIRPRRSPTRLSRQSSRLGEHQGVLGDHLAAGHHRGHGRGGDRPGRRWPASRRHCRQRRRRALQRCARRPRGWHRSFGRGAGGEVAAPSSAHSKAGAPSLAEKVKRGARCSPWSLPASSRSSSPARSMSGGGASIVHVYWPASDRRCRRRSTVRTAKVWLPRLRPLRLTGLVQARRPRRRARTRNGEDTDRVLNCHCHGR